MKGQLQNYALLFLTFFTPLISNAATFTSVQTGDWASPATWGAASAPTSTDDNIISAGTTVTITGSGYTHTGDITVATGAALIADCANSSNGLTLDGGDYHIFGQLTLPFPDKDLIVQGNSFFWGHPSAVIVISDDWEIGGNANVTANDYFVYTPLTDFAGQDTFEYFITDQVGGTATALVVIIVSAKASPPVVLTAFEGYETSCNMLLTWETSSEEKNDYFQIEHSVNGRDFLSVARIQGSGNTEIEQFYQYMQQNPSRKNYYRLRQVDL